MSIGQILPKVKNCKLLDNTFYKVEFDTVQHLPIYSVEIVTREHINSHIAVRKGNTFKNDSRVVSSRVSDYTNSGYDRGHLTPAANDEYDTKAMQSCFLMTNMLPQKHSFNAGIWESLEKKVREWANDYDSLLVFTGGYQFTQVGKLKVPELFYKIIYSVKYHKSIYFIMKGDTPQGNVNRFEVEFKQADSAFNVNYGFKDKTDLNFWK